MTLLEHAFRQLVLRPALSATVIAMLALGIGASTAIFSMFYQVLVQPLPVPEPERLVNIVHAGSTPDAPRESFSYAMLRDLEAAQAGAVRIAGYIPFGANIAYEDGAFNAPGVLVSGAYFDVLGLRPALGRLIRRQDEPRVGESAVVVLSYDLWRRRFGGDPNIVGREVTIAGQPLTVVGVAPAGFSGTQLGERTQVFVPITMRWRLTPTALDTPDGRSFSSVRLFARLGANVSAAQAATRLGTVYARILRDVEVPLLALPQDQLPRLLSDHIELQPGARGQGTLGDASRSLTLLLGVTVLVLVIVCVNVANLLLVRGASRAGEIAVRVSIGATRGRLVAELLAETAVPAAIGGALGLLVARLMLSAVTPILPARLAEGLGVQIGPTAVGFAALATLLATAAFGVFPALRAARSDPALAMKGHAAQALGGRGAPRLRAALVTVQIAFSLVLLVLAGLFAASLRNVAHIDLGMNVDSLVSFRVSPGTNGYDGKRIDTVYAGIAQALEAEPGVTAVASAAVPVIAGNDFRVSLSREGAGGAGPPMAASFNVVGPSFFRTLGISLRSGRDFTPADQASARHIVIVNERFVREYGLGPDAVGKRIGFGQDSLEIAGVVADAAYRSVKGEIPPQLFVPAPTPGNDDAFFGALSGARTFYVRSAVDPAALLQRIPRVVAAIDPALPVQNLVTMRRQAEESIFVDRLVTILSASFAALATLLAAIGIYGVMAYNIAARTRELGLRLALGAEPRRLRAMVLKQVAAMTAIGVSLGLAGAIGSGRAAEALLFGLSGHDPKVLATAAAVLAAVVLAASYWPARRASRIAPTEALRHE